MISHCTNLIMDRFGFIPIVNMTTFPTFQNVYKLTEKRSDGIRTYTSYRYVIFGLIKVSKSLLDLGL